MLNRSPRYEDERARIMLQFKEHWEAWNSMNEWITELKEKNNEENEKQNHAIEILAKEMGAVRREIAGLNKPQDYSEQIKQINEAMEKDRELLNKLKDFTNKQVIPMLNRNKNNITK